MRKKLRQMLPLLMLASTTSQALQVIEVSDGETALGKVSTHEMTRIAIADGGRIADLWGASNLFEASRDEERGQVFVRLSNPAQREPLNLFVTDNGGRTYTLILTPVDIPAETVMLKPRGQNRQGAAQWERSQPYTQTLKRLLVQMARDSIPDGYEVVERGVMVPLWQEAIFRFDREYRGDAFSAEVYTLTNRSGVEMVMEEREFYRPGVVAVAIEKSVLPPAAATRVYVIHQEARRD